MVLGDKEIYKHNKQLLISKGIEISIDQFDFYKYVGLVRGDERLITSEEVDLYIEESPKFRKFLGETVKTTNEPSFVAARNLKEPKKKNTFDKKILFDSKYDDDKLISDIENNMRNLYDHEKGTSWLKWGSIIGGSSVEKITAKGFKAILEQNKILIRQNELLRRQNEIIIELLKKDKEDE